VVTMYPLRSASGIAGCSCPVDIAGSVPSSRARLALHTARCTGIGRRVVTALACTPARVPTAGRGSAHPFAASRRRPSGVRHGRQPTNSRRRRQGRKERRPMSQDRAPAGRGRMERVRNHEQSVPREPHTRPSTWLWTHGRGRDRWKVHCDSGQGSDRRGDPVKLFSIRSSRYASSTILTLQLLTREASPEPGP